jgi:5-formyltetrahydrofolate cyclo-ligase
MDMKVANDADLKAWRKAQRAELLARRNAVPEAQRRQWNAQLTQLLSEAFPAPSWMTVGFYWPFQGEFDPRFVIRRLRRFGARAALPEVVRKGEPLQFREWWPGAPMASGVYDLPVPQGTELLVPQALLIPPIGFDAQGYRLGYGGGFFDRTLAALQPRPLAIGVGFEISRIASIRPQPHDIPMDFIVTEAGVHYVGKDGLQAIGDPARALGLADAIVRERARLARGAVAD